MTEQIVYVPASERDRERIDACLQACAGIPTEQLTHVYMWGLLERLEESQQVIAALQKRLAGPASGQSQ